MTKLTSLAAASLALAVATNSLAAIVTYDFAGYTYVGGHLRSFTGVFEYEDSATAHTVYYNGTGPLQQGFRTSYLNSMRTLRITLDDHESVISAPTGSIDVNNTQQAEPGSQVPEGLSVQAWPGTASGTINGVAVHYLYLAFLPVEPAFNWDALNSYFGGNAEAILQNDPSLLPANTNPEWTGTTLNPSIEMLASSLFLGTIHHSPQGTTTTVNTITSFELRVPAPASAAVFVLAGVMPARRRRG